MLLPPGAPVLHKQCSVIRILLSHMALGAQLPDWGTHAILVHAVQNPSGTASTSWKGNF